ncbi:vasorin [Agrilus planipennis]|uniref:Vasorin n=1 Tax=Agrilus planipennis TaxID=224129 RepID=A0A1W4WWL6_AGRPL|nr:vasorin [Agrilus planipennis]XP_025829082.1 vasorin [Agrilus planipennis]
MFLVVPDLKHLFLLFSIGFYYVGGTSCKTPLLKKCKCGRGPYDGKELFIVNCTNTGFQNTDMLVELPEETQVLIFTGNYLPTLPWNIFGDFNINNLNNLRIIDMTNNHINEIKGKTYHHVQYVERLILNHNNLTISDEGLENHHHPRIFSNFENLEELHLTNAFADYTGDALSNDLHDIFYKSNLTKLQKLHLEQNEIKGFRDPNVFCDLISIRDLYLGQNYIPGLNFNITCLKKLRFVDLESNQIRSLNENELHTFDLMTYPYRNQEFVIDLNNNPFNCDFGLNTLQPWVRKTNVTVRNRDYLKCIKMKYGLNYTITLKKYEESKHHRVSGAVTILVAILSIILFTLLGVYIYLSKDTVKMKLEPFLDIVSRKVHYTKIESQNV